MQQFGGWFYNIMKSNKLQLTKVQNYISFVDFATGGASQAKGGHPGRT